jgi:hypothetical protein
MSIDPKEMQQHYRNVFGTPEGKIILGDLLTITHFGETLDPEDKAMVAEYNVGVTIARMAGALDLIYPQLGIPVKEEKSNGSSNSPVL